MEDRKITEKESLEIITQMIQKTKHNVVDGNNFVYLGLSLTALSLTAGYAEDHMGYYLWYRLCYSSDDYDWAPFFSGLLFEDAGTLLGCSIDSIYPAHNWLPDKWSVAWYETFADGRITRSLHTFGGVYGQL